MSATQFLFLEERLSPFRGEYLPQINRNLPELLAAFDAHVLEGATDEAEARFKAHDGYATALSIYNIRGEADRPVYERLSSALGKLQGEARQAFLYGLRKALLTAQTFVSSEETIMHGLIEAKKRVPELVLDRSSSFLDGQLLRLREVSSGYRDIYQVMVDVVRQALSK